MGQVKISLFIPTFNVESTLISVLERIPQSVRELTHSILIFDNGSRDQTVAQAVAFAQRHPSWPISVFQNQNNYLLGGSTVLAIDQALRDGVDYLVTLHSDGQADPAALVQFYKYCLEDKYDFILGSRLLPSSQVHNYSKLRLWGNYFFCWIQQLILKQKVYDLGAYLAFNLKTLKTLPFAHINPNMAYHPNLILIGSQVSPRLFRFCEFPVSWGGVESSNINPYKYFLSQLWMLLCIFLKRYSLKKNYLKTMNTKIIYSNL